MFWKAECNLHIQTFSPNHIDAHILGDNQPPWRLTRFYGRPEGHRKHESWFFLRHLHARASLPWVCMGNFNEILHSTEKQGGRPKPLAPMLAFKETLLHCELRDLSYQGYPFTWRNGRPGDAFVEERIDRGCANTKWQELFPTAKVIHQQVSYSDHDPILLYTQHVNQQVRPRRKRIQRFEERWTAHEDCEGKIEEAWSRQPPNGSPMFRLFEKSNLAGCNWWPGVGKLLVTIDTVWKKSKRYLRSWSAWVMGQTWNRLIQCVAR